MKNFPSCCMSTPGSRFFLGLLFAFALSACGGGGSAATSPPAAPVNVSATARDGNNLIGWTAVSGATSYNVYWSTTSGVSKANGEKIPGASNPLAHTGIANGTTYYYVVTAQNAGGESVESLPASGAPAAAPAAADPLFGDQWHLKNTGQLGGVANEDMNVEPVWATHKGTGVRIAVVDDGLEIGHEDLAANVAATVLSYNYLTGGADPSYDSADAASGHGTAVAGIVAARDLNGLGVRGAAPRANLVGYNMLQNSTLSNEADAMTRGSPNVHVSNNSWGSPDDGDVHASTSVWRNAIEFGLANGRDGLGTLYAWAAGNGGNGSDACFDCIDNSNYDGYANHRGVIAVAAVDNRGRQSTYSEPGANILVSAPGGEYCDTHAIATTDRTGMGGTNSYFDAHSGLAAYDYPDTTSYTKCMNGTSAAAPAVAGVIALILEANPDLGWRDVRLILAQSARKNDATDPGWSATGGSPVYHFNHKYGFGVVDAAAAVALAQTWTNAGPQLTYETSPAQPANPAIPDNNPIGVSNTIRVVGRGITSIEFIEITFSAPDHPYAGDLSITLTSPSGTTSQLSEAHYCPSHPCNPYNGWVFGSVRHLGEAAYGDWTLTVKDRMSEDTGTFQSWKLKFYGR